MRTTLTVTRERRDGLDGWRTNTGRWIPFLAGADDDAAAAATAEAAKADAAAAEAAKAKAAEDEQGKLGDSGKAALESERTARREAEKRAKDAEKKIADAERKERQADDARKAEQGQWKELAEARAAEVEQVKAELAKRDEQAAQQVRRDRVARIARTLGFRDPQDAFALLSVRDDVSFDEDALVENALSKLKDEKPYLADNRQRTGADIHGPNGGSSPAVPEHLAGVGSGMQRLMRVKRNNG